MLSIAEAKAKLYLNEKCCPLAHLVLGRGGTKAYLPPPNPHTFLSAIIFLFQDFFGFIPPPPTNTQHTFKSIARCPFQVTISILNYII